MTTLIARRDFLRWTAASAGALAAASPLLADPYGPAPWPSRVRRGHPVWVRGRVRTPKGGLGGVAVTDGITVVDSAPDGTFEFVTTSERRFISLSLPSGYAVPRNPSGTARFYEPLLPGATEMNVAFDLEPLEHADDRHVLLLLADVQTQDGQEMQWFHQQTVPDVRTFLGGAGETEVVAIACGDIMYDRLELYGAYERGVSQMGVPFFQVVGNHDLDTESRTDEASTTTFSRHFGPRYYSFNRGAVHYVVLDDVFWHGAGYLGYLGGEQLAWLKADLQRVTPGGTVIVAAHIPTVGSRHLRLGQDTPALGISVANREALYRLLEPFDAHVLCGHTHETEHVFHGRMHEHVNGTVCGAWWSGPICADGTPSGYTVYEIDGSGVSWRYKSTGYAIDHQMRLYPHGSDPKAPDDIVANVWDWDPSWQVVWYEDGEPRGAMTRRLGTDPLSVRLHTGPDLPPRRPWVEPYATDHLFFAPAARRAREVRVEATDRFGRVYSEVVKGAGDRG